MAWGESLDQLLQSKAGRLVLEDFLRSEYSEENLLFWSACEDYKKITNEEERGTAAGAIYREFVQEDAVRQINIDWRTRQQIQARLSDPGLECFDRAQTQIHALLENDCYPRFLKSERYQALLDHREPH